MGDSNWPGNRPQTDILPALPEAGDLVLDAMKRFLASTFLTAMLALPGAAWAQSVQDQIIAQLTQQGFATYEVSRTFLGRVRIVAISGRFRREIVFNPTTGEILRDFIQPLDEDDAGAGPVLFDPNSQGDDDGSGDLPEGYDDDGPEDEEEDEEEEDEEEEDEDDEEEDDDDDEEDD